MQKSCRIKRGAKWAIKRIYLFCNLSCATLLMIYCFHRWISTAIVATTTQSCLKNKGINFAWKFWAWHGAILYCCTSITHTHIYECKSSIWDVTKNRSLTSCVLPSSFLFFPYYHFLAWCELKCFHTFFFNEGSHT